MNPLFKKIIINNVLQHTKDKKSKEAYTPYQLSKEIIEWKIKARHSVKDFILVIFGIFSAAFGLKAFLLPNNFIDGGATGMALLLSELFSIKLAWLLVLINLPFMFLANKVISREFAVKTALAIGGLALCVGFVQFPIMTHDKLLVAVFGGFCLGAGIGLCIRGGAVIDGTEVLAIFLSRKLSTTVGDIIIMINIVIFTLAAYMLSIETALYSMITYLSAAKTMDFVIEGIEEYIGVTIISLKSSKMREMLINKMGRGVTVYTGTQGYGKSGISQDVNVLYTVITRLELSKLNTEIERIDPNAFVVMSSIKDTKGGMIKKRSLKH